MTPSDLPPDLDMLARVVDGQSPHVRELFHYALVMLMLGDGKATIIERQTDDGREWLTVRTGAGELFSIVKPDESEEMLETLTILAREILKAERANPDVKKGERS